MASSTNDGTDLVRQLQNLSLSRAAESSFRLLVAAPNASGERITNALSEQLAAVNGHEHLNITAVLDSHKKTVFKLSKHLECAFSPWNSSMVVCNISTTAESISLRLHHADGKVEEHEPLSYRQARELSDEGVWRLVAGAVSMDLSVRLLPRPLLRIVQQDASVAALLGPKPEAPISSGKRAREAREDGQDDSDDNVRSKRQMLMSPSSGNVAMIALRPSASPAQGRLEDTTLKPEEGTSIPDFSALPCDIIIATPAPQQRSLRKVKDLVSFDHRSPVIVTEDPITGQESVMKFMTKPTSTASELLAGARQWVTETEMMDSLDHDNILPLSGVDGRFHALLLPYHPAGDLTTVHMSAANSYFNGTLRQALRIAHTAVQGLAYLHHTVNRAHNDIKPKNILLTAAGNAVLCDFGIATPSSQSTLWGTPAYLPPENILPTLQALKKDVYAYGMCLWWLAGVMPLPEYALPGYRIERLLEEDEEAERKRDEGLELVAQMREAGEDELGRSKGIRCVLLDVALRATAPRPGDRPTARTIQAVLEAAVATHGDCDHGPEGETTALDKRQMEALFHEASAPDIEELEADAGAARGSSTQPLDYSAIQDPAGVASEDDGQKASAL